MNRDQVIELLQVVCAYDNRNLDEVTVRAWCEAASRANWRAELALEAVHEHYARSTEWLMPGHVTTLVRAGSRLPAPVEDVLALQGAAPASEETRQRVMAQIRDLADHKDVDRAVAENDAYGRIRRPEDGYMPEPGESK